MIVYHGTTNRRALNICREGFTPRKPSNKVWFARSRGYAHHRARTQARRRHDRPVILRCEISLHGLKEQLGPRRVIFKNGIPAVGGKIPVSVIKSRPDADIKSAKLLQLAKQWIPEYFQKVKVDPDTLRDSRQPRTISMLAEKGTAFGPPEEDEVLDRLLSSNPKRRVKGLQLLGDREDVDICQWCMMFLDDPSVEVRVAALRAMKQSDEWALKDPSTCVRLEALTLLKTLDPQSHRALFELALHDPNSKIFQAALKLVKGRGFSCPV
jgi:hypothetical protein